MQDESEASFVEENDVTKRFWKFVDNTLEKVHLDCRGPETAPRTEAQYKMKLNE